MSIIEPDQKTAEQFQIGDDVVYVPEGVITTVTGYVWHTSVDKLPSIIAYELACGIAVPASSLSVYIGDRRMSPARQYYFPQAKAPVDAIGNHHMPSYPLKGHRLG